MLLNNSIIILLLLIYYYSILNGIEHYIVLLRIVIMIHIHSYRHYSDNRMDNISATVPVLRNCVIWSEAIIDQLHVSKTHQGCTCKVRNE